MDLDEAHRLADVLEAHGISTVIVWDAGDDIMVCLGDLISPAVCRGVDHTAFGWLAAAYELPDSYDDVPEMDWSQFADAAADDEPAA